jgi:hypothetical protein
MVGCTSVGPQLPLFNQGGGASQSASVPISDAKIAFAQVTGAPPEEISTLMGQVTNQARGVGLTVVQEGDPTSTHLVKGYLSAVGGSSGTVVIYVWDVLNPAGTRLHRISGQEQTGGSAGDPWSGVSDGALGTIAQDTVGQLAAWLRSG